jgi:hypothetical protein
MGKKDRKNKPDEKKPKQDTYQGDVCIQLEFVRDYIEVNRFCEILKTVEDLRIVSYNWSEKNGLNIYISLKKPAPLGEIIVQMPQVEEVRGRKKEMKVKLTPPVPETSTPTEEADGDEEKTMAS